jgi:hypothetical protein
MLSPSLRHALTDKSLRYAWRRRAPEPLGGRAGAYAANPLHARELARPVSRAIRSLAVRLPLRPLRTGGPAPLIPGVLSRCQRLAATVKAALN